MQDGLNAPPDLCLQGSSVECALSLHTHPIWPLRRALSMVTPWSSTDTLLSLPGPEASSWGLSPTAPIQGLQEICSVPTSSTHTLLWDRGCVQSPSLMPWAQSDGGHTSGLHGGSYRLGWEGTRPR